MDISDVLMPSSAQTPIPPSLDTEGDFADVFAQLEHEISQAIAQNEQVNTATMPEDAMLENPVEDEADQTDIGSGLDINMPPPAQATIAQKSQPLTSEMTSPLMPDEFSGSNRVVVRREGVDTGIQPRQPVAHTVAEETAATHAVGKEADSKHLPPALGGAVARQFRGHNSDGTLAETGAAPRKTEYINTKEPLKMAQVMANPAAVQLAAAAEGKTRSHKPTDDLAQAPVDARGVTVGQTRPIPQMPAAPAQQPMHQQIAVAIVNATSAQTELTLRPAELGRVQITLQTADTGITVQLTAERPETLDLLRRHSDDLARDLAMLGFEDIGFSFTEDNSFDDQTSHEPDPEHEISTGHAPVHDVQQHGTRLTTLNALDLRV